MKPLVLLLCAAAAGCTSDAPLDDESGPPPVCEHVPRPARSLRVFAVGHELTVSEGATYASYASAFRATVDREVVPHLATDRPNVLVFPESVAFTAAFVGARGDTARTRDSAFLAYVSLQGEMTAAFDHYRALAPLAQIGTWILLAASDPIWRAFDRTFSTIARDHHAWVIASIDVGDVDETTDTSLADPDRPSGSPIYEVKDGKVYNQAIIYSPDGELVGRLRKEYLTDPEHGELGISGHLPERVAMELPGVANIAALISRDAWMPDLQERVAAGGAELVLQHEAFDTWTVPADGAPWPADNLQRSGWAAVQKQPELRMAAVPMLVGNFFDVGFDGQTFIATQGTPTMERRSLLAQAEPSTGFAAIAPWVAAEPASGTLEQKRAALRSVGQSLAPGGTGTYVEGTVWADLDIPDDDGYAVVDPAPVTDAIGASHAIAPSGVGRQRNAAPVALADGTIVVAWEDTRFCTGQIVVARSRDGGATFGAPIQVSPWNHAQHTPSLIALPDGTLVAAWQEVMPPQKDKPASEIRVATSRDGGITWSHRVRVDLEHTKDAWQPALAADPTTGTVHLAFVDTRDGNRRVYLSSSRDAGASWSAPHRLDPRDHDAENVDPTLANEWSPRIVAQDHHVVVAYTHRERPDEAEQPSWDAYTTESSDDGTTFGAPTRLDLGGSPERIAADTAVAIDATGTYRTVFSTYRGTRVDSDLLVDGIPAEGAHDQWWPSLVAQPGGDFIVTWQDDRSGGNDIYAAHLTATGVGAATRIDDGGDAQAWRPRAAVAPDGGVVFVWEDSRTGHAELRIVKGALP